MDDRRMIVFISGIDPDLVGFEIDGMVLKKTPILIDLKNNYLVGEKAVSEIGNLLFRTNQNYWKYIQSIGQENSYYLYLDTKFLIDDDLECIRRIHKLINCFRLFKTNRIGFFSPIIVNESGGGITNSNNEGSFRHFEASNEWTDLFSFYQNEEAQFRNLYNNLSIDQSCNKDLLVKMMELFNDSYRTYDKNIKFILRIIILEMIVSVNSELIYRISRSIAVFLGEDLAESKEIKKMVKDLYDIRSKFVHQGSTNITDQHSQDALDLARRVIVSLSQQKDEIANIRETLDESAFGSNLFRVSF